MSEENCDIDPVQEVGLIKSLLESKHKSQFDFRVRLGGYTDNPTYALELTNGSHSGVNVEYVSVLGEECTDVLEIYDGFLSAYWRFAGREETDPGLKSWHDNKVVAVSHEELMIKAVAKGLIK